jgi:succinoglycan biosynthesis transport protein ExoP
VTQTDQHVTHEGDRVVPSLVDYLQVLRRRWWLFLLAVLLVPAVAAVLSSRQPPAYQASAEVLLKPPSTTDGVAATDPARAAQTAAELARIPEVATRAIRAGGVRDLTAAGFLKKSSVSPTLGSDILTFSVTDSQPEIAKRLGTAYARTFSEFQDDLNKQQLERTQSALRRQLSELEASGLKGSAQYRMLARRDRELTAQMFGPATAIVVQEADRAQKVGPRTFRNQALGLMLGLVLGLALVFLWDALDTRVRSVDTLREGLGLRLLGRLPSPPRRLRKGDGLIMLADPLGFEAAGFRVLRTSFDYANADYQARTIMFTSAVGGEGKSTTVANLAVALARAGRRVVLIDSDLRRPSLHRLFNLAEQPGLIDIELGSVELEDALRPVPVTDWDSTAADGGRPSQRRMGKLEILTAGHAFHAPDELGVELTVARIAESLKDRVDLVLIDAAPLLAVGDAMALSAHVDALVLVVRLNGLRSSEYDDLRRTIASSPTRKLGFILTGAATRDAYTHFYRYAVPSRRGDAESAMGFESSRAPDE